MAKSANNESKTPAAAAADTQQAQQPQLYTVEELATKYKTKPWQLAGLKVANGWAAGKRVTEAEYKERLAAWLAALMSR